MQFIGFAVILCGGLWLMWWAGVELYCFLRYQLSLPIETDDIVGFAVLIVIVCAGGGLVYYAGTHAPFTIALDFDLKV